MIAVTPSSKSGSCNASSRAARCLCVGLVALFVVALLPANVGASSINVTWSTRAPITPGREGAAGSFINGLFYVTHGFSAGDTALASVYSPLLDTWVSLPAATVARSELTGAAAADSTGAVKHYAIGGRGAACAPVCNTVEIFNPITNSWSLGAPMPTARAGLGSAVVNNLIYVVGGRTCGTPYCGAPLANLEIYNPVTNTWAIGTPMPTPRMDIYAVTALGSKIYILGGDTGGVDLASVDIYDTGSGVWSAGVPMPTARANAVAGTCSGHIFVIGGTVAGTDIAIVEGFDPATNTWSTQPPMPTVGSELAASAATGPNLIMATGSGIFGASRGQNYALECQDLGIPAGAASCVADAILVKEHDAGGGVARIPFSESRVGIAAAPGPYALPPGPYPREPSAAQAHADARVAGVDYQSALLGVSASTVYSRCDANAVKDPNRGLMTDAYGIGGIQDLSLRVGTTTVTLNALDFELQAFGAPPATSAMWACDLVDVGVNPPPPVAALCALPAVAGGTACATPLDKVCSTVTVAYDEVNAPFLDAASGQWIYSGSLVHIHVDPLLAGAAVVDVYLGYVQVGITGGPATPASYVPHVGCLTLLCT
jgi:hypothetical protein